MRRTAVLLMVACILAALGAWSSRAHLVHPAAAGAPPAEQILDRVERLQRAHHARTGDFDRNLISFDRRVPIFGKVHLGDASLLSFAGCESATIMLRYRGETHLREVTIGRDPFLAPKRLRGDGGCVQAGYLRA